MAKESDAGPGASTDALSGPIRTSGTRKRASLSREVILETAMRLADSEGATFLTLSRLGRALGADPTALYRHFRNKDELLLAMGDHLMAEAVAGIEPGRSWVDTLRSAAWSMRRAYLARPALGAQSAARFTGGDAETQLVHTITGELTKAGIEPEEAARHCRAFAEVVLGHIGITATLLSLSPEQQALDVAIGRRVYATPAQRPGTLRSAGTHVATALEDENEVFRTLLETYLEGLRSRVSAAQHDR
ncbi:transcriptional regulator, TetR family [Micromonospora purpureochromogenes]|uniref:Transcriptional regulator, TetR family n=1 Tax=Micromonospora purpureochromogenes TaxID=47872 RepID=A0A1C4XPP0_9ACTN|nr:TetR family transcriptional regulator [Micromonospora purpureochromogenes]SCF10448.1 transcriptional regulator, TetR family [Micromonospora purpureochromogenes]